MGSLMKAHGIRSNDGVVYSKDQWQEAYTLVVDHLMRQGYKKINVSFWEVTGAIAGWAEGKNIEFYMRDLVQGVIRDTPESYQEYQEAVDNSGWETFDG